MVAIYKEFQSTLGSKERLVDFWLSRENISPEKDKMGVVVISQVFLSSSNFILIIILLKLNDSIGFENLNFQRAPTCSGAR